MRYLPPFIGGTISTLIWIYLLLFRGNFWRVSPKLNISDNSSQDTKLIAIILPARNEAETIGRSVESLLRQNCRDTLHVFVVDDASSDGTANIARETAEGLHLQDRLTVVVSRPLPTGWTGKLWAVHQGIQQASALNPDYFLLTDADILHAPENTSRLRGIAEYGSYDLVSFMVKLNCRTLAEKLLIPAFVYFFFQLYPPSWISDQRSKTAGAAGGCMLISPTALQRAGGIESIRGEIIDDCALARRVKRSGGKVWLGLTHSANSLREYGSFSEVGRMISRTAFNQLNHSWTWVTVAVLSLILVYLLPWLLIIFGTPALKAMGILASAAMIASYLPMVRFYSRNPLWASTLPVAAAFYGAATIDSALQFALGRGGQWKGRMQDHLDEPRTS